MRTLDEIILEWQCRTSVRQNGEIARNWVQPIDCTVTERVVLEKENRNNPMDGLQPGKMAFVRSGAVLPAGQTTLDTWCSDWTSETNSSIGSMEHARTRGSKSNMERVVKTNRKHHHHKRRKVMCRADRVREWELRGGRRDP